MALLWEWSDKMGKITIKQKENTFRVDIYDGNALAIFIWENEREGTYILYNFFADKKHCNNIIKSGKQLISDEVVSIELNLYYKNAQTLLNILVSNGYKVSCYYEKPKQ